MAIYDKPRAISWMRPKNCSVAREFGVDQRQAEVIFRVASAYIDAENAARGLDAVKQETGELLRVKQLTQARVDAGQELAHESRKARLAEQRRGPSHGDA